MRKTRSSLRRWLRSFAAEKCDILSKISVDFLLSLVYNIKEISAGVMELADVTDSKSVGSDTVWVRVPPPAPEKERQVERLFFSFSMKFALRRVK